MIFFMKEKLIVFHTTNHDVTEDPDSICITLGGASEVKAKFVSPL